MSCMFLMDSDFWQDDPICRDTQILVWYFGDIEIKIQKLYSNTKEVSKKKSLIDFTY